MPVQRRRDPELEKRIVELITTGHSERYTARAVGCANTTVHKVKEKYGICGMETTVTLGGPATEEVRWRMIQHGFDVLEYKGRHHRMKVKCLKCGAEMTRDGSWPYLVYGGSSGCPNCKNEMLQKQRQAKAEMIRKAREEDRAKKEAQKQKEKREKEDQKRAKMQESHICECCGRQYTIEESGYNSTKYCSKRCQQRTYYRKHDQVRDYRKRWRKHDSDITLEKLFKRDSGRCYICGERCDWTDKIINENGTHIAGNRYPSIDHVFPLSKGGTDTWDNIKLAHRICNSLKRDKEGYNGKT